MKTRLAKNSDYNKINKLLVNLHNYHVHCVIIRFWVRSEPHKYLYEDDICKEVNHINGYLVDAPDFYIESRGKAPEECPN